MVEDSDFRHVGGRFPALADPPSSSSLTPVDSGLTLSSRLLLWSRIAMSVALPATVMEATAIKMEAVWTIETINSLVPAGGRATGVSFTR